jgi:ATP synthase protein I
MADRAGDERLKALEARIEALKRAQQPPPRMDEHYSGAQLAWRMVIELVAGLMIGFGIGWGLDALFGTGPWLLVLFILLGFVAGVKTMLRTAREAGDEAARRAARDEGGA